MGVIIPPLNLSRDDLSAFYTTDSNLSEAPFLILYGPASTAQATPGSSRIQCHIFTPAGLQSYPRLAISPSSGLYGAVQQLPRAEQGDEVSRSLAYGLFKYFSELSEQVKDAWVRNALSASKPSSALKLFSEAHAADLTMRMSRLEDARHVINSLQTAFQAQFLSFLDVDVLLPDNSITIEDQPSEHPDESVSRTYGQYTPLVEALGEWAFLPTTRVRRAPSRATAANRSTIFSRNQKEMLRREMCELLDTEERYVAKLHDLVHNVATDFRQRARQKHALSSSPTEAALASLFPPALDEILRVNSTFLDVARTSLEETENDAIADIEATDENGSLRTTHGQPGDPTGVTALAHCLINVFPHFSKCYGEYMQAHVNFMQHLKTLSHDGTSSFARRVQETGEQKLTSLLIEPVQRLPRYSLYIENIIRQLPIRHVALKPLLRAKDIIADICAQDQAGSHNSKVIERLRMLISAWPSSCRPMGRLITAADLIEMAAPFSPGTERRFLISLVFTDNFVLLERNPMSRTSARGLMTELENRSISEEFTTGLGLKFLDAAPLAKLKVAELGAGSCIQIMPCSSSNHPLGQARRQQMPRSPSLADGVQVFRLGGSYEGKAPRLNKEITKARVEGRYGEVEREHPKWAARDFESGESGLGLFSAVVEESALSGAPAKTRIVIDKGKCAGRHSPNPEGADVVASLSLEGNGFFRIEVDALDHHGTRDLVQAAELMPVLCKRLNNTMQFRASIRNPALTVYLLRHNEAILQTFNTASEKWRSRSPGRSDRGPRHHSPVKAVASLFGSTRELKPLPAPPPAASVFSDIANLRPTFHNRAKSEAAAGIVERTPSKARLVRDSNGGDSKLSPQALEQTFDSYVLALHARKGNVVGRSVTNRKLADEAMVNELYNVLLDEPQNAIAHEQAAQSQVDVLFAAFEKFLHNAWNEQMGALIPRNVLVELQSKADTLSPADYEDFLLQKIAELAPQNQRALVSVIGVLVDLMEGTHNDGDRGALMMAVTEMIVREKNAHDYVPIFDRLVEDYDTISQPGPSSGRDTPVQGSTVSFGTKSAQNGSLSSKASSLSKRFGRGILSRQSSKTGETGSKLGSLRGWGRATKSPGPGDNPPSVLDRARSVDLYTRSANNSRPTSRDRPPFLSAFDQSCSSSRPQSGHSAETSTSSNVAILPVTPRAKRRSSLPEVTALPAPNMSPLNWTPSALAWADKQDRSKPNTPAATLARVTLNGINLARTGSVVLCSPEKDANMVEPLRLNSRPISRDGNPVTISAEDSPSKTSKTITTAVLLNQGESKASMPIPKGILTERPASGNTPPPPQSPVKAAGENEPPRARLHGSKKLKERLLNQHEAISGAKTGLRGELAKLGEDFAALGWTSSSHNGARMTEALQSSKEQKTMANIGTRLKALETKVPHLIGNLQRSIATLEVDMSTSLQGSERRVHMLEKELRDTNAVNEELFKSTQEELTKIFKRVKVGEGLEAIKASLESSQKEAEGLRTENLRLKKEIAELKARVGNA